jgi:hypothetical protein
MFVARDQEVSVGEECGVENRVVLLAEVRVKPRANLLQLPLVLVEKRARADRDPVVRVPYGSCSDNAARASSSSRRT